MSHVLRLNVRALVENHDIKELSSNLLKMEISVTCVSDD